MHSRDFYEENLLTEREKKKLVKRGKRNSQSLNVMNRGISVFPKTPKQQELINAIQENSQIFVLGPAGTGKTYVCASMAAKYLYDRKIDRIIITRPNISGSASIGLFPGTLEEKMAPWVAPFTSVLQEHLGEDIYNIAVKKKNIEVIPFETMRGSSFNDAFVMLDEAQNVEFDELKMFLTRVGENSKVIVNGDLKQSDLKHTSGYKQVLGYVQKYNMFDTKVIEFDMDDCVRSGICRQWLEVFDKEGV